MFPKINNIFPIETNHVVYVQCQAAAPIKNILVASTEQPNTFNFYRIVNETLQASIEDIRSARIEMRKKFPKLLAPNI